MVTWEEQARNGLFFCNQLLVGDLKQVSHFQTIRIVEDVV